MGIILQLEESDFAGFIDDGQPYGATVVGVRLRDKPYKDDAGNTVKKIEFHFKLVADDGHDGQDIWGETSTKFNSHPQCRLRAWSESILGMPLPPRFELDTDMLVDRRCIVVVGKKTYEKDGETKNRNFVREVLPTRENAKAIAAALEIEEPF